MHFAAPCMMCLQAEHLNQIPGCQRQSQGMSVLQVQVSCVVPMRLLGVVRYRISGRATCKLSLAKVGLTNASSWIEMHCPALVNVSLLCSFVMSCQSCCHYQAIV